MKKLALLTTAALVLLGSATAASCCKQDCYAYPDNYLFDRCQDRMNGDFYLYGDWLLWNVRRCGLDFVLPDTNTGDELVGKYVGVSPDYKSGFRLGLGFRSDCGPDFSFRWTHFTPHYSGIYANQIANGFPTRIDPRSIGSTQLAAEAVSNYDVAYNVFDFEVGSWKDLGCDSRYRLFVGAKLAYIDEDLGTAYSGTEDTEEAAFLWSVEERLDSKAFGLSTGIELNKDLGCNFGFFTKGAVALLVGDYKITHNEYDNGIIPVDRLGLDPQFIQNNLVESIHGRHKCLLTNVELALGFDYTLFCQCDFSMKIAAGYEFHGWYNTRDFLNLSGGPNPASHVRNTSTFGLDGLFVRLEAAY